MTIGLSNNKDPLISVHGPLHLMLTETSQASYEIYKLRRVYLREVVGVEA